MWQAYALAFLCLLAFLFVSRRNGTSATPVGATLEDALSMLNHPAGVAIPLRYGYGLRAPAASAERAGAHTQLLRRRARVLPSIYRFDLATRSISSFFLIA